jgi:hypothetical protein
MSNILAFPDLRAPLPAMATAFDEAQVLAFAARHPERVTDLAGKIRLASQVALLLVRLVDDINSEVAS